MEQEIEKIVVTPEAFEKIKKWESEGKKVYNVGCVNLGCLRHFFTPNENVGLCPSCHCMISKNEVKQIKSSELEVKVFVPEKITKEDISIETDWKGTIILNIRQHWRPIKLGYLPTGEFWEDTYHQMRYGNVVSEEEAEDVAKSIESGTYVDDNWDFLVQVCKEFGFELEQK